MNMFLAKHKLTRGNAIRRILMNDRGNKAKRILNSGKEGGFRAGYIKNLSNSEWNSIIQNLDRTNMNNSSRKVFRNAKNMRPTYKVNTWTAQRARGLLKAGAAVGGAVLLAREKLTNSAKQRIYREIETRFGKNKANIARRLLNKSQTPPVNVPPEVRSVIQQNFTEMNVNQQLALGNNMARARSGNANAQRRVNTTRNTARFQSSVAAAMVTPFAKGILRNISGSVSKPVINKVASMSKNQLVTTIQQKIPVRELAAIGERTYASTSRNSRSQNMIRSALNLKRKLQSGRITNLTNNQVSLLLQGIYKAPRARNLFLRG
jgi:hypothetical protein